MYVGTSRIPFTNHPPVFRAKHVRAVAGSDGLWYHHHMVHPSAARRLAARYGRRPELVELYGRRRWPTGALIEQVMGRRLSAQIAVRPGAAGAPQWGSLRQVVEPFGESDRRCRTSIKPERRQLVIE